MTQMWIYCCVLMVSGIGADKLKVVEYTVGGEDASILDPKKYTFSGETNQHIITAITVATFVYNSYSYINCIGFTYNEDDNECDHVSGRGIILYRLNIREGEYITHIHGRHSRGITKIEFQTNKRRFGPFGRLGLKSFTAHNSGTPLLYVKGIQGLWIYQLTFVFHEYGVLELTHLAQTIAKETMDKIQYNIEEIMEVYHDYKRMLPDVAHLGCYKFQFTKSVEAEASCDLKILLEQMHILSLSIGSLKYGQPRNLLHLKDYDSATLVDEVQETHDFHELLTSVRFDLQTVISATEELGQNLGNYFKKVAEFDVDIAQKDRDGILNGIRQMKADAESATNEVSGRLSRILGFAVGLASGEVAERGYRLGLEIATNCNPLKHIFGGTDLNSILDRVEDLTTAIRKLSKGAALLASLGKFVQHMQDISSSLTEDRENLNVLKKIVDRLDSLNDTSAINSIAEKFVSNYLDYSPSVTNQDMAYTIALLENVAEAGCSIIEDSSSISIIVNVIGIVYDAVSQDCIYIGAEIAKLSAYYDNWYSFQFELVNTLVKIVRGGIAEHMANKISNVNAVIDVKSAAIGSLIVEINYQAIAHARCNILEYNDGGRRPDVCKKLLFRDDDIQRVRSYRSSLPTNERTTWAYVPTTKPINATTPYINLNSLIEGNPIHFQLPIKDKAWLRKYRWQSIGYNPQTETAYFVQRMEFYIPGLKCENGDTMTVTMHTTTGQYNPLYDDTSRPSYIVTPQIIIFVYEEPARSCADNTKSYSIAESVNLMVRNHSEVCVVSQGNVPHKDKPEFTLPSLFASFKIQMHKGSCNVTREGPLGFNPLITVRLSVKEVFVHHGLDECWPDPCAEN